MTTQQQQREEGEAIPVHRVVAYICDLCLAEEGGECHVPGCSFFIRNAPTGDELHWWRSQVEHGET